jgi:tRNA pseudouridine55 synthase
MRRSPPVRTSAIDGLLLVDKPSGVTSHDAVAVARRALGTKRVGHTGTLDPFATGLLVLLVGRGTRLAQYVAGEPKVYDATIVFGAETTTDDLTGEVTRVAALPNEDDVDRAVQSLTGPLLQTPPDYSAKRVAGRRAYAAARAGTPLALDPVPVVVHSWLIRRRTATELEVTITCGGGTYVRALARDLGRAASSAAHLGALRRIGSGPFDVTDAVSLDDLDRDRAAALKPLRLAIPHLPTQVLGDDDLRRVRHGNSVATPIDAPLAALLDSHDQLVAIARGDGGMLRPCVVMQDD